MLSFYNNRWFLLVVLSITWGSSFLLIKKSLEAFNPYQIGAFRVALSGAILFYPGLKMLREIDRSTLLWALLTGFFGNFLPMFLFPLAQTHVSSSMAAILDSLVPVFILGFSLVLFGIKSRRIQVTGAVVGFGGAALLMLISDRNGGETQVLYALLIIGATASYAVAAILIKHKLSHVRPINLSSVIYIVWMIPSVAILLMSGLFKKLQDPNTRQSFGYLLILSVIGTCLAMILYYKLIHATTPVFASSVTYLIPVVAIGWGIVVGERFTLWQAGACALIFASLYMIGDKKDAREGTSPVD